MVFAILPGHFSKVLEDIYLNACLETLNNFQYVGPHTSVFFGAHLIYKWV